MGMGQTLSWVIHRQHCPCGGFEYIKAAVSDALKDR